MVNKVILIGNLGQDPELRSTGSGMQVANLSVATTEKRKDRDGNWNDHTEWHRVIVFGKTAENVHRFCKKGKQLYIEGRLQTKKWQDKEGKDRWTTEVVADNVRFLGGGGGGAGGAGGGGGEMGGEGGGGGYGGGGTGGGGTAGGGTGGGGTGGGGGGGYGGGGRGGGGRTGGGGGGYDRGGGGGGGGGYGGGGSDPGGHEPSGGGDMPYSDDDIPF